MDCMNKNLYKHEKTQRRRQHKSKALGEDSLGLAEEFKR